MTIRLISAVCGLAVRLCCLTALSACVSVPAGTGLDAPRPESLRSAGRAWVGSVRIVDPSVTNPAPLEDSLRASIADFVRETRRFEEVGRLPGCSGRDDVMLDFLLDRYRQQRVPHPAYFPAAVVTLTLYTWFGGPIYRDESDLSGRLTVKDADGRILAAARAAVRAQQDVSLWSPAYAVFEGKGPRTTLIQKLLDRIFPSLNRLASRRGLSTPLPGRLRDPAA